MEQRIVIYRLGSLGDTIVALPLFHKIAQSFPNAKRTLLTNVAVSTEVAPVEMVLAGTGLVHDTIHYPIGLRSIGAIAAIIRNLRALNSNTLIYLAASRGGVTVWRDLIFFRLCGFRNIIGLPLSGRLQIGEIDPTTGFLENETVRLTRQFEALGSVDLDAASSWNLNLSQAEIEAGRKCVQSFGGAPFLAINMGGKAAEKDWGADRWAALARRLTAEWPKFGLLVVGARGDGARAKAIADLWTGPVVDACGRLSPRECAAALGHASLFIGHDSGPLHLASSQGVACVGLFGPFNRPKKWHPYGSAHVILHRPRLEDISIDDVLDAVRTIGGRRSKRDGDPLDRPPLSVSAI